MKNRTVIQPIFVLSIILLFCLSIIEYSFGQSLSTDQLPYISILGRKLTASETYQPKNVHKVPGHYTKHDWKQVIDQTWGPGLPTSEKLAIFDRAWNAIDQGYGAFMNLDVNIDSLKNLYRPEIEAGVSRGRFAAIMNYFAFALKDAHTFIADIQVNWGTRLVPGLPLFVIGSSDANNYFGACLTPLPDSSLLVYKVVPNHRLGLTPGDIVLGYDGIPWKELYKQLWQAQLPVHPVTWACHDESMTHILLQGAGLNWHLFDTIDIVKYNTGDTLHLSTSPMRYQNGNIWGNEQLPVHGVPMPNFWTQDYISWGIVSGTQIGYIYVASWFWEDQYQISEQFYDAIYNLMFNHETEGMIIDFRLNYGGTMEMAHQGYSLLFNETLTLLSFDVRGNPDDHFYMIPSPTHTTNRFIIVGDSHSFYDKPIAVLTGPNAVSNGDWESLRMQYHPMVRTFGKSTNGAFTPSDFPDLGNSDWYFTRATGSGYLIDGHQYLAHTGANIDEEVWLTQEDVAKGEDTVVKRALAWINSLAYAHNVSVTPGYIAGGIGTATVNAIVENPDDHTLAVTAIIKNNERTPIDTTVLYDDGNHHDGASGDGFWGGLWKSNSTDETCYLIDVETKDKTTGTSRRLPDIVRLSTIGPIVVESVTYPATDQVPNPGDNLFIKLTLKNKGATTTAPNLTVHLSTVDSCVSGIPWNDLPAGSLASGATAFKMFQIQFSPHCQGVENIDFTVDIASDGFNYWQDSFSIQLLPVAIATNDIESTPLEFLLGQNYPNPFNMETTIGYSLPVPSLVNITIYDLLGQEVRRLIGTQKAAGSYHVVWDGRNELGNIVTSGVYFYHLNATGLKNNEQYQLYKKLLLLK